MNLSKITNSEEMGTSMSDDKWQPVRSYKSGNNYETVNNIPRINVTVFYTVQPKLFLKNCAKFKSSVIMIDLKNQKKKKMPNPECTKMSEDWEFRGNVKSGQEVTGRNVDPKYSYR